MFKLYNIFMICMIYFNGDTDKGNQTQGGCLKSSKKKTNTAQFEMEANMIMNTFFVCPNCGNDKEFTIFTSSFQVVKQSPELGKRIDESNALPNLRQNDNYIECQLCFQRSEYDKATTIGKKYVQTNLRLRKEKFELLK